MMRRMQYRKVDTSTLAGLRTAERLKASGWILYNSGLFMVYFYRRGNNGIR